MVVRKTHFVISGLQQRFANLLVITQDTRHSLAARAANHVVCSHKTIAILPLFHGGSQGFLTLGVFVHCPFLESYVCQFDATKDGSTKFLPFIAGCYQARTDLPTDLNQNHSVILRQRGTEDHQDQIRQCINEILGVPL